MTQANHPPEMICDEPTCPLDVSQILNLLQDLRRDLGFTHLRVSHRSRRGRAHGEAGRGHGSWPRAEGAGGTASSARLCIPIAPPAGLRAHAAPGPVRALSDPDLPAADARGRCSVHDGGSAADCRGRFRWMPSPRYSRSKDDSHDARRRNPRRSHRPGTRLP